MLLIDVAPLWTDKVVAIGTAIGALGFVSAAFAAFLAYDQVKETRRDRYIEAILEFGRRWDDDKLTEARESLLAYNRATIADHIKKCLNHPSGSDLYVLLRVPNFYEDLAMVAEAGLDGDIVAKHFGPDVLKEWAFWEDAIYLLRQRDGSAYTQFEVLVERLLALSQHRPRFPGAEAVNRTAAANAGN
jgi:hypothetical protein